MKIKPKAWGVLWCIALLFLVIGNIVEDQTNSAYAFALCGVFLVLTMIVGEIEE